jgi:hypothetical protein
MAEVRLTLRANINREVASTALMTLGGLVNHYRRTELLAENKTDKTQNDVPGLPPEVDTS